MTEQELTLGELMRAGPIAPIRDPYSLYARLRREDPVMEFQDHLFISRFEDVSAILKNDTLFSSRSNGEGGIALVMGRTIIGMDGREHLKHRALITPALAPRSLRGDFPKLVNQIAHEIIDGFVSKGAADLVRDLTFVYPLRVFTEILGLDPEGVEIFHNWAIDLTHVAADPARGLNASQKMKDYLEPVVAQRRAHPGDDLISGLAMAEVDGERLTDEEVTSFLRLLVIAGAETTYHLMGSALFATLSDPDLLDTVRADRSKISLVLDETLRWESPIQLLTRQAAEDTEVAGVRIPRGKQIIVSIGSANRDERQFPDPDKFNIHRRGESHIAFGFGRHFCAGSRLALLEATVGLNALLDRLHDLRLDTDVKPASIIGVAFRSPNHLKVKFTAE